MSRSVKSFLNTTRVAAALGFLSIQLSGEISQAWMSMAWFGWLASFLLDRYPVTQATLRRFETPAVFGLIAMLGIDFFLFHNSIFITITHFLLLLQFLKLVGEKLRKDCFQIFIFSFFLILAACTLSVDAWHGAILLALIPTSTAAFFWNQMARENEKAGGDVDAVVQKHYRRMSFLICAMALPLNLALTIGIFILFPRLAFNAPIAGFHGNSAGYADQLNLAQQGALQQNSAVVLWITFPADQARHDWTGYIRGDTLSLFDGRKWQASKSPSAHVLTGDTNGLFQIGRRRFRGPLLDYTITLTDTSAGVLFVIGRPIRLLVPLHSLRTFEGGSLRWLIDLRHPLRYEVFAEPYSDDEVRPIHSELPAIPMQKIRLLADQIAGHGSAMDQAHNIEQYLQKNYRYAVSYGDHIPNNPVEEFLFVRHQGTCGHFASAMALMLRVRNIPSRIVAGYLNGEWNEPAGAVVVRERHAHAWVEAYIQGKGWVSFDPTPIQESSDSNGRRFFSRVQQYWDYLNLQWNRFVIQYDLYSQIKAFEVLKGSSNHFGSSLYKYWSRLRRSFRDNGPSESVNGASPFSFRFPYRFLILFALAGVAILIGLNSRSRRSEPLAVIAYRRFLQRMARSGNPKQAWETGLEFAERLIRTTPNAAPLASKVTDDYYQVRYKKGIL